MSASLINPPTRAHSIKGITPLPSVRPPPLQCSTPSPFLALQNLWGRTRRLSFSGWGGHPSNLPGFGGGEAAKRRLIGEERGATITFCKSPSESSTSATTRIRLERGTEQMIDRLRDFGLCFKSTRRRQASRARLFPSFCAHAMAPGQRRADGLRRGHSIRAKWGQAPRSALAGSRLTGQACPVPVMLNHWPCKPRADS